MSGTVILSRNVLNYNYRGFGLHVKLAEKCFVHMQDTFLFAPFQPTCLKWGFHFSRALLLSRVHDRGNQSNI